MLKRFDVNKMTYFNPKKEDGEVVECLIPIPEEMKVELEVRSDVEVTVSVVTGDGEIIPLEVGKIVRWSGRLTGVSAVQIAASSGFWYSCHKSRWFELVDPTPLQIEMTQTKQDVLRSMIDERLRAWEMKRKLDTPLTEDEKDELVLDIVHGDLEFDEAPDEFGLGYAEKLEEFARRTAEQADQEPPTAVPDADSVVSPVSVPLAADPKNSSST